MSAFQPVILFSVFLTLTTAIHAEGFPTEPPRLKDAEAQGLYRVSAEELKTLLPGSLEVKGTLGKRKKTFNPDGTVQKKGSAQKESDGTWRIDEKNNGYCNTFTGKKGTQEGCFAVFRASDGTHYFDYEIDTGFFSQAWRHVTE